MYCSTNEIYLSSLHILKNSETKVQNHTYKQKQYVLNNTLLTLTEQLPNYQHYH